MKIETKFGLKIKHLRNELSISQEELAHRSELHRTYLSSVELGKRNISIRNIEKLANALDVNIIELFKD
jgi:transcriptional regulator with XRE-family HTH domain